MKLFRPTTALVLSVMAYAGPSWAQEPSIIFPAEGEDVRGEITARFQGIPEGGYAIVKLDGQFKTATAEPVFTINTFDNSIFPPGKGGDGPHVLNITTMNAGGRQVGQATVTFNVANNKVDPNAPGQRLVHWTNTDFINKEVSRFRVFAESNATIEGGGTAGGGGGGYPGGGGGSPGAGGPGGSGGPGGGDTGESLDFQVSALIRRVIRDVNMVDGSANIRSVVDRAFQRQRGEQGSDMGGGGYPGGGSGGYPGGRPGSSSRPTTRRTSGATSAGGKAPWSEEWQIAAETGQYFVKMIQPTGLEVNATRKSPSIALGDLLPTFPQGEVRPGSTWETTMTFLADLSTRDPLTVRNAPMTFTSFEDVPTPGGRQVRCAKLETRFRLPDEQAMEVAKKLAAKTGGAGGAGRPGASGSEGGSMMADPRGGGGGGGGEAAEVEIALARTNVSRVLWFDINKRQVMRSEDIVDTYFEQEAAAMGAEAGGMGGPPSGYGGYGGSPSGYGGPPGAAGAAGAAAAPAEPTKVSYNLRVTTWLDDTIPPPTDKFNGGAGTAHSRDSVQDATIDRVRRPIALP